MMNGWVYKRFPRKGRVGNFGRSWRTCLSTTKVCDKCELKAPLVKILISEQSSAQSLLPSPQSMSFINSSHNSRQEVLIKRSKILAR